MALRVFKWHYVVDCGRFWPHCSINNLASSFCITISLHQISKFIWYCYRNTRNISKDFIWLVNWAKLLATVMLLYSNACMQIDTIFFFVHSGQSPAEADLNLLETARRCELYGVKMHASKVRKWMDNNFQIRVFVVCVVLYFVYSLGHKNGS